MSLASRIGTTITLCLTFSVFMGILGIVSLATFIDWAISGSFSLFMGPGACLVGELVMIVIMSYVTIPTAMEVVAFTGTKASMRAMYILMLWPIIFAGFMFGNSAGLFVNAYVFGWPLFFASAILMPAAAYTLKREATITALVTCAALKCYACNQLFYIERGQPTGVCPHCHTLNENPKATSPILDLPPSVRHATSGGDVMVDVLRARKEADVANAVGGPDIAGLLGGPGRDGTLKMSEGGPTILSGGFLFIASIFEVFIGTMELSFWEPFRFEFNVALLIVIVGLACVLGSMGVMKDHMQHLGLLTTLVLLLNMLPGYYLVYEFILLAGVFILISLPFTLIVFVGKRGRDSRQRIVRYGVRRLPDGVPEEVISPIRRGPQ